MSTTSGQNLTNSTRQSIPQQHGHHLDWILFAVPGAAFLLGMCLFSMLLRTQRQKRSEVKLQRNAKGQTEYRLNGYTANSWDKGTGHFKAKSLEAASYENVDMAVYSNEDTVAYNITVEDEDDYLHPDSDVNEAQEGEKKQDHLDTLHPPHNVSDTDGDSYENMENPLYAQSCKSRKMSSDSTYENDYLNLDLEQEADEQSGYNLHHAQYSWDTDGESYEDMDGPHVFHQSFKCQEEEGDDSYEKMDTLTPGGVEAERHAQRGSDGSRTLL